MSKVKKKKKRKTPYIAGAAALKFKVQYDWEVNEARDLFNNAKFNFEVDTIFFEDSIAGMKKLSDECVDLVIADPPFCIKFNGKGSQYNRNDDLVIEGYQEVIDSYL